jgi:hypothetical protein
VSTAEWDDRYPVESARRRDYGHNRQYFEWGKRMVDALSQPNPILKAEFEGTYRRFEQVQGW